MYGNLVVSYNIGCTIGYWYHGGINMHGSNDGRSNDPIGRLNGVLPSKSLSCCTSNSWWVEPLDTWVGKLLLTYTMVETNVVTCCWICSLSLLVTN